MKTIVRLFAALSLLAATSASAQIATGNEFATQTAGKTVIGTVGMCIDQTNVAVPCGTGSAVNAFALGSSNVATSQVAVALTSTLTVAARAGRRSVTVTNITGTQRLFCTSGTASLANGQFIGPTAGSSFTFPYSGALNCISDTTPQTVSVTEAY